MLFMPKNPLGGLLKLEIELLPTICSWFTITSNHLNSHVIFSSLVILYLNGLQAML